MTADPVTVTSLKYVAEFPVKQKVGAVPVLSIRGKLLGIVNGAWFHCLLPAASRSWSSASATSSAATTAPGPPSCPPSATWPRHPAWNS